MTSINQEESYTLVENRSKQVQEPSASRWNMNNFNLITIIGHDYSSRTTLVQSKNSNEVYAVKSYNKGDLIKNDEVMKAQTERCVMKLAKDNYCPFIVDMIGHSQTESHLHIFMEHCSGGHLMFHLQKEDFSMDMIR
jgi:serine/threonine protein kinase